MKYKYKYCSNCGNLFKKVSKTLYLCPQCDFRIFISPKPSVGILIFNKDKELLLIKRLINPGKGLWGIPGGFIDLNENLDTAIKREVKEEIGLTINKYDLFGSFYGNYMYRGIDYKTISIIFISTIDNFSNLKVSDNESSEFKFFNLGQINPKIIGTEDVKKAVISLIQSKHY